MTPLPESPYCRVRARVATIWADDPDEGTHPDWRPAIGERVTLTPSIGEQLLVFDVDGPAPIIVTVERVQCEVDADGWLVHADGRPVYIEEQVGQLFRERHEDRNYIRWLLAERPFGLPIPRPAPSWLDHPSSMPTPSSIIEPLS